MTPQMHSPLLVNEEETSWTQRFGGLLTLWKDAVDDICLHDHVKLRLASGEMFWVEVCMRSTDYWIGILKSRAITAPEMKLGDLCRFHRINVFCVAKYQEERA